MKTPPLCRYCGKPIAKQTRVVWLRSEADAEVQRARGVTYFDENEKRPLTSFSRYLTVPTMPTTMEECRRYTNGRVTAVKRTPNGKAVSCFHEWDGERYADRYFCTNNCARLMGYACAELGKATKAYNDAVVRQKETEKETERTA